LQEHSSSSSSFSCSRSMGVWFGVFFLSFAVSLVYRIFF